MIKIKGVEPSAIKVGDADVSAVYHGSDLVWKVNTNLFDVSKTTHTWVNSSGVENVNTYAWLTGYIPASEGEGFVYDALSIEEREVVFYNDSKKFISRNHTARNALNAKDVVYAPTGTAFVRFGVYSNALTIDKVAPVFKKA